VTSHTPTTSSVTAPAESGTSKGSGLDLLFYDGGCGLCHRTVSFTVARDRDGSRFRYAPLAGPAFQATFSAAVAATLPDSIVLRTADGRTLVRAAAVLHLGERLGGGWRTLARLAGLLPRWLLDLGYDALARIRRHLFQQPTDACPRLPPELRSRFLS
jgi:predicted DCC family thiol-disulfide oxidoreductase YuxK